MTSEIVGKDSAKGKIASEYVGKDPLRLELFKSLTDGRWHSTTDLWRRVKKHGQLVGLVRIGKILDQFQSLVGEDFLERREGPDINEWRVTPLFISLLTEIVQTLATASEKKENVADEEEKGSREVNKEPDEEDKDL